VIEKALAQTSRNPRKVKRFVNLFRLRARIGEFRQALGDEERLLALARWVYVGMEWPELGKLCRLREGLLPALIAEARDEPGSELEPDPLEDPLVDAQRSIWSADARLGEFLAAWAPAPTVEEMKDLRWL